MDLGIVADDANELEMRLLQASSQCDIIITSGGVSVGSADHVKAVLSRLGQVVFGRLNMKPGKPTTFATIKRTEGSGTCLVFGLPGNPVSCLVTKTLLVDPAVNRMCGAPDTVSCLAPEVLVNFSCESKAIPLDEERPEYHRVRVVYDKSANGGRGGYTAYSTGNQRSSRLLSMRQANALVCLV